MPKPDLTLSELIKSLQAIAGSLPFDPKIGKVSRESIYPDSATGVSWERDWNTVVIAFDSDAEG